MKPHSRHILLVNLSKNWGGGEKWFFSTGKSLAKAGWEVRFLVYPNSKLHKKLQAESLPAHPIKLRFLSLFNPIVSFQLKSLLKKTAPSYLLLNASHELKTAGLMGKWLGIPHIILRRGLSFPFKSNPANHFFVSNIMTAFLTNSQDAFDNFEAAFPEIKSKPHAIIRNGVDTSFYQPELQQKGQLCIASRLSSEKGIKHAIDAFNLIRTHNLQLHIWGEGPEKAKLQAQIQYLNLEKKVFLHGFEKKLKGKMARCSLFLLPSTHGEGTSNSLIEAMSLGLPAIAFNVPSMKESIQDGQTGFVVPKGNIEAFAQKILQLVEDEDRRKQMGLAARQRCLQVYSQSQATEKLIEYLNALS